MLIGLNEDRGWRREYRRYLSVDAFPRFFDLPLTVDIPCYYLFRFLDLFSDVLQWT